MSAKKVSRNNSRISDEGAAYCVSKGVMLEQDFILGESLGRGGFGEVIKATRRTDDNEFAIKIIKFESNVEDAGNNRREAKNLSRLNHNNIVRYYNSWIETAQIPREEYERLKADSERSVSSEIYAWASSGYINNEVEVDCDEDPDYDEDDEAEEDMDSSVRFQTDSIEVKYLFIQMELCEKRTLRTVIDKNLYLDEDKLMKYFREICEGLLHIHKNGIVHRDLKPENIFLTSEDVIKIGDFGLSKQIAGVNEFDFPGVPFNEFAIGSLTGVCGTVLYTAPELFDMPFFTIKADMYSLGVTYFEMCSKPMTVMEKCDIFPLTSKKLKNMDFPKNASKKKYLIKNLLLPNTNDRPSCENILKIMNSEKSLGEIKEIIQQQKKVPFQQLKVFDKMLKANNLQKIDSTNFFLKKAVEIFELHGARNIPGLTFVPPFSKHWNRLTTLLNIRGNSVSVSNTSRVAFLYYVDRNKIKKIRRYSVGKIFNDRYFLPVETQECVFEAISPDLNDYIPIAEVLYMAQEVCQSVFGNDKSKVRFYINHRRIFSTILKHYEIVEEDATIFTNAMIQFAYQKCWDFPQKTILSTVIPSRELRTVLSRSEFRINLKHLQMLRMSTPFNIATAEKEILSKFDVQYETLLVAFREINNIVENIVKFGIEPGNIFVSPLLITEKSCSGFMFKVEWNSQAVIATGDRFDSLILGNTKGKKKNKAKQLGSAIGISFQVVNILRILNSTAQCIVDVMIYDQNKANAIPIFRELLARKIKCQIINELTEFRNATAQFATFLIADLTVDECTVYEGTSSAIGEIYKGKWRSEEFSNIFKTNS